MDVEDNRGWSECRGFGLFLQVIAPPCSQTVPNSLRINPGTTPSARNSMARVGTATCSRCNAYTKALKTACTLQATYPSVTVGIKAKSQLSPAIP